MNLFEKEESYYIIGKCFEVHNELGPGFLEIVYKDALEFEFKNDKMPFDREVRYNVNYKGTALNHHFYADFVVFDSIILEIKAKSAISDQCIAQAINYLKVSGNKLALIVNFGEKKLTSKRVVL
ncbi:MAG: GxxExxY protein [Flavobacteriia bacterium]|jgi:GxxExxY protein